MKLNAQHAIHIALEADNRRNSGVAQNVAVDLLAVIGRDFTTSEEKLRLMHANLTQHTALAVVTILIDDGVFTTIMQEDEGNSDPAQRRTYLQINAISDHALTKARNYYKVLLGQDRVEVPRKYLEQLQQFELR